MNHPVIATVIVLGLLFLAWPLNPINRILIHFHIAEFRRKQSVETIVSE